MKVPRSGQDPCSHLPRGYIALSMKEDDVYVYTYLGREAFNGSISVPFKALIDQTGTCGLGMIFKNHLSSPRLMPGFKIYFLLISSGKPETDIIVPI